MLFLQGFALLVLPCAALGVAGATSKADKQLSHIGQLSAADRHPQAALRGGPQASRKQQPIVALQSAIATHLASHLQARKARTHRHVAKRASQSKLDRMIHEQETLSRRQEKALQKLGLCRGMKLKWWIKVRKKCNHAYGPDSKWDRSRLDGKCGHAWSNCNTGFYAVCCTQPLGPRNMEAYCENQNLTAVAPQNGEAADTEDRACEVQHRIDDVHDVVEGIKDTVKLMDEEKLELRPEVFHDTFAFSGPGPGPGPAPGPVVAARAPTGILGSAPAPAVMFGPPEKHLIATPLESRCDKLKALTQKAMEKLDAIKHWANKDGIPADDDDDDSKHTTGPQALEKEIDRDVSKTNMQNPEAKDPDLVFSVKGVLVMGTKLKKMLKDAQFCTKKPAEEEEDDDPVEVDLKHEVTEEWASDDDEDEEEELPPVTEINETAVLGLLNWEADLHQAVDTFETKVHPHGYKWWRYRYEYTVIESLVLSVSCIVLYCTMWLLHGVSFFQAHKFYKTGHFGPGHVRLYRYAWVYFLFHAGCLMVMVTTSYMLYIPWGKQNIFNWFADAVHDYVGERSNVPYLGYSWLYMFLDVQFQLFVCFALYALFICMVVHSYTRALREWKHLSDGQHPPDPNSRDVVLFQHLDSIMKRRVRHTRTLLEMFKEHKLRLSGVEELSGPDKATWNEFKLHLYLTDGLGKSIEYLVEVSLTTNIFLSVSALLVAWLAHYYQVAFMYFLPGFATIGFLLFVAGWLVSIYFRKLADTMDHTVEAKWVTMHKYCRGVQILLYCLFFSFSRLLLSNDIFEYYPVIYMAALIGLGVCLIALGLFGGQVIKETSCALILPPHLSEQLFNEKLKEMVLWHIQDKCRECGAEQHHTMRFSKHWAGVSTMLGEAPPAPTSGREESYGPKSFR